MERTLTGRLFESLGRVDDHVQEAVESRGFVICGREKHKGTLGLTALAGLESGPVASRALGLQGALAPAPAFHLGSGASVLACEPGT